MNTPEHSPMKDQYSLFESRDYLDYYYSDVDIENAHIVRFLADAYDVVQRGGRALELGGGPSVYQLVSMADRVDEITFTDLLESNLLEVDRWRSGSSDRFQWDHFIRATLAAEGGPTGAGDVTERADEVRRKITRLEVLDIADGANPGKIAAAGPFSVISSFFVAESVFKDIVTWKSKLCTILDSLEVGGYFVTGITTGSTAYRVNDLEFTTLPIEQSHIMDLLAEARLRLSRFTYIPADTEVEERGYGGIVCFMARKV
ncbi:guanitoxin biosynthesis pre-guanitoxin forming N-methyltransferase GntF [Streptomyces sp. NPDC087908]|uniref:guanitoxin biosynthesis pre-guanitoxin forming N-methyltransferase GntF n=1 Tax=Streptomyces sp. NPDC087908 TaxID=3365820 RepID=UPI0037F80CED